jgi:hypothetical protein
MEKELYLLENHNYRTIVRFTSLPLAEAGRHYFRVELKNEGEEEWHEVAAVPLTLAFKPEDEGAEGETG